MADPQTMTEGTKAGLLDRTLGRIRRAWRGIGGAGFAPEAVAVSPELTDDDAERLREHMRACLETRGGEVSARGRAAALGQAYLALNELGRRRFLRLLAEDFDVDPAEVDAAIGAVREAADAVRALARDEPALAGLEDDLRNLLARWFDVDFLELRRIAWDSESAALLEKLIEYEAVHAIESWDDLKNRLDSDRRCFAFFHPRMPDEPLIFVEVALVDGMADSVQALLDESAPVQDPSQADTAIFYSISNAQRGLAGISFGSFLIKRVVDSLTQEFKGLDTFATLSPAPGFQSWLDHALGREGVLKTQEIKALSGPEGDEAAAVGRLRRALARNDWPDEEGLAEAMKGPLLRLCARYLAVAKRPGRGARTPRALDPVANFHLTNGARLERINWLADRSDKGLRQSAGIMVNYLYGLNRIEANHEAYRGEGTVASSSSVRGLLKA
jgi:malonyl-CoA decarboxylase